MASSPEAPKKQFALRFISGKYQGGEFPIAAEREIFIGRSNELDVVLVAEHLAGGDAEEQGVADLAGGAGDGHLDGRAHA